MCYPHDENDEGIVENFVDDAVIADTDPTQAEKITLQDASPVRTLSKVVDRAHDSAAFSLRGMRSSSLDFAALCLIRTE